MRREVRSSSELDRIIALPRREWNAASYAAAVDHLTNALRVRGGTMQLFPHQAAALVEIQQRGGGLIPLGVGGGKTLISLLAPRMLGAKRALLLAPAALVEKTEHDRRELSKHWAIPGSTRIFSYERLSQVKSSRFLDEFAPDLIVADEAHRLKNPTAGVTKRVTRYMAEHPNTKFVALSGTFLRKSLAEFAHLAEWALGEGSPLPRSAGEVATWDSAISEEFDGEVWRIGPGALMNLASAEDRDLHELEAARRAVSRRIVQTSGVVTSISGRTDCDASLRIVGRVSKVGQATEDNFEVLRNEWRTPDGEVIDSATEHWRHARALALGLHYVWIPRPMHGAWRKLRRAGADTAVLHDFIAANRPPEAWMLARSSWSRFVRETLAEKKELDTPAQVEAAVLAKELDAVAYREWKAIEKTFDPVVEEVWHDDSVVTQATAWMKQSPGIVWVEHILFGEELSKRSGAPYYGAGTTDAAGRLVRDAKPAGGSIIASIDACGTGQNLQAWNRNLVVSPPSSGSDWEQLIGRTHRTGQRADEVTVDVLLGCFEHFDAWEKAKASADLVGSVWQQAQKILIADVVWPESPSGARWEKVSREDGLALLD